MKIFPYRYDQPNTSFNAHQVKSEGLAQAVAHEWRSQKDAVQYLRPWFTYYE